MSDSDSDITTQSIETRKIYLKRYEMGKEWYKMYKKTKF